MIRRFAKRYVHLLVDEIRIGETGASVKGNEMRLAAVIGAPGKNRTCNKSFGNSRDIHFTTGA